MADGDNLPPPPLHKAYSVANIKSHVPLQLNLDQLNHGIWSEIFSNHCKGFDVLDHIDETYVPTEAHPDACLSVDPEWHSFKQTRTPNQYNLRTMSATSLLEPCPSPNIAPKSNPWRKSLQTLVHPFPTSTLLPTLSTAYQADGRMLACTFAYINRCPRE